MSPRDSRGSVKRRGEVSRRRVSSREPLDTQETIEPRRGRSHAPRRESGEGHPKNLSAMEGDKKKDRPALERRRRIPREETAPWAKGAPRSGVERTPPTLVTHPMPRRKSSPRIKLGRTQGMMAVGAWAARNEIKEFLLAGVDPKEIIEVVERGREEGQLLSTDFHAPTEPE